MTTVTAQGIPGGPLNIGLVGSRAEVVKAWRSPGWHPADAITLRTSLEIVGSVLLHRPYPDAPVSNLFYDDRHQDLAFEKPVGGSADQRHHVRLWLVLGEGVERRPVWLGSATFDRGVGISHYTGQITHRIGPDIDAERNLIIAELTRAGMLSAIYQVGGVGPTVSGRNGGGDRYFTDGEIAVGVIRSDAVPTDVLPQKLRSPAYIELKNSVWSTIVDLVRGPPNH
jgi:LssY C-terminus